MNTRERSRGEGGGGLTGWLWNENDERELLGWIIDGELLVGEFFGLIGGGSGGRDERK